MKEVVKVKEVVKKEVVKSERGRPRKFTDAAELANRCQQYIELCHEKDKPVLWIGLACYLDCAKDTLNAYQNGEYNDKDNNFSEPIKKVLQAAELDAVDRLYSKYTIGAMFNLKCNHGYIERQHVEQTITSNIKIEVANINDDDLDAELIKLQAGTD